MAVTDHDTTAAIAEVTAGAPRPAASRPSPASRSRRSRTAATSTCSATSRRRGRRAGAFLAEQRAAPRGSREAIGERLAALGMPVDRASRCSPRPGEAQAARIGRPQVARAMVAPGTCRHPRGVRRWLAPVGPAFVPREGPSGRRSSTSSTAPAAWRRWRTRAERDRRADPGACARRASTRSRRITRITTRRLVARYVAHGVAA